MAIVNNRDVIGSVVWFVVSIIFGVVILPVMIFREWHQWKYQNFGCFNFEWWDVARYGMFIGIGGVWHWFLIEMIFDLDYPWWWAL